MIVFLFVLTSNIRFATCSGSSNLVVGQVGDTVTLACKYDINTTGLLSVCWGRHQSWFSCENTVIATDGLQVNYRESHRFSLASGLDRGDISLTIRAAQESDAGMYICRIEIPGLFNDISYNVYLFISSSELDPKRVVSETQLGPTTAKQEKQVYHVSDSTTHITELYLISEKTADDTNIHVGEVIGVVQTEQTIETFIINTIRVGAIIFIPGLIIALLFRLRRSREQTSSRTM